MSAPAKQTPVQTVKSVFDSLNEGQRVKLARTVLDTVLTEKELQETLFSRSWFKVETVDGKTVQTAIETPEDIDSVPNGTGFSVYHAGFRFDLIRTGGLWTSSSFTTTVYDLNGNPVVLPESKVRKGSGNVDMVDQLRFAQMRADSDIRAMLHNRERVPTAKPSRDAIAKRDEVIDELRAEREKDRAEMEELRAMIAKLTAGQDNAQSA